MKKLIYLIALVLIVTSCSEDNGDDFSFVEPVIEWNISKSEVKQAESRKLSDEEEFYLKYSGVDYLKSIEYYFDEIPGEIWLAQSDVNLVHNEIVLNGIVDFLVEKYGSNYEYHEYDNNETFYVWNIGHTLIELNYDDNFHVLKYYRILK